MKEFFSSTMLKNQHSKDSSDDTDDLISPCFQINKNVELKDVPTNGEEYLLKVINERKRYQSVTISKKDYSKYAKNQSLFVEGLSTVKSPPNGLKPTVEWQNIQVADFSKIRMYVSRMKANKASWPKTIMKIDIDFNNCVLLKQFFISNSPTMSCLFGFNQTMLDQGLEILVKSLNNIKSGETISQKTGQWIYALLSCIELPLLPDTISILRDLSRKCAEIRSRIELENEKTISAVAPLNIFICLVTKYFRQHDLGD